MELSSKIFNKAFIVLSVAVFIIVAIRAAVVPFCHDETATFFYYIQPGDFLPYTAHPDANNHILNSFLSWICYRLFGDSPFSLRLPNIAGLIILAIAIYRLAGKLTHVSSKVILVAGLLFSFNWLGFFDVCRGYGISMALVTLAFSYILSYFENKRTPDLLKIYLLLNLALCANLTLIIAVVIITGLLCLFQLYHHLFFKAGNIILLCIHAAIIVFWAKYSFFMQQHNLLYAGQGDSYWHVTFVTLIYTIIGKQNSLINRGVFLTYILLLIGYVYVAVRNIRNIRSSQYIYTLFLAVLFNGLIMGFYLLKKWCGINFPEDRAGLLFYLLFILNIAFIADRINLRISNTIATCVLLFFTVHFIGNLNFRKHTLDMYAVIPKRFYTRLVEEQKQSPQRITIGGNRFRELFYAFMNYRNHGELNLMDIPEDPSDMFMDDDYYIAYKVNRKQYLPYYDEIDTDRDYGFTLLKRKELLTRLPAYTFAMQNIEMDKKSEFYNLFEVKDTVMKDRSPLLVEFNFKVESADKPLRAWIVMQMDSADGQTAYYKRIPLNWLHYNWSAAKNSADLTLQTGPLPAKIHRFVCYLWNDKKQHVKMRMDTIKVFHLEGHDSQADARVNADF